jgi:hypothetical protein
MYGNSRTLIPVTILNGGTVSSEVNVGAKRIVGILMPSAWTAGTITIQALTRQTGAGVATFGNVVDSANSAYSIATPTADTYIALAPTAPVYGLGRIKIVAGGAQAAQRDFFLAVTDY